MTRLDISLSLAEKCGKRGWAYFASDGSCKGHSAPPSLLRVALLQDIFLVRENVLNHCHHFKSQKSCRVISLSYVWNVGSAPRENASTYRRLRTRQRPVSILRSNPWMAVLAEVSGHKLESSQTRVFVWFSTVFFCSTKCSWIDSSFFVSRIFCGVLKPE